MRHRIESDKSFVRDTKTHAILRVDSAEIDRYNNKKQESIALKNEINTLKREMDEIKKVLAYLLKQE